MPLQNVQEKLKQHDFGENILNWMGDINRIARWQEYYSRLSEKVASITNCPILDLRTTFLTHSSMENMIGVDGIHPSFEGHALIKDVFQKTILTDKSLAIAV